MAPRTMPLLVAAFLVLAATTLGVTYVTSSNSRGTALTAVPSASPTVSPVAAADSTATPDPEATPTPTPGPLTGNTSIDQDLQALDAAIDADPLTNLGDSSLSDMVLNL